MLVVCGVAVCSSEVIQSVWVVVSGTVVVVVVVVGGEVVELLTGTADPADKGIITLGK